MPASPSDGRWCAHKGVGGSVGLRKTVAWVLGKKVDFRASEQTGLAKNYVAVEQKAEAGDDNIDEHDDGEPRIGRHSLVEVLGGVALGHARGG